MGFNIAIIVTNENKSKDFEAFSKQLGLELVNENKLVAEHEASENWKKDYVDIAFTEKSTLLFVPISGYNTAAASVEGTVYYFVISDVSNSFNIEYAENGKMKRVYTEVDGEILRESGEKLMLEKEEDWMNLMSKIVEKLTGKSFWERENTQFQRYKIAANLNNNRP